MDTAGILVPKIDTPEAQWMLALTGALPRERFDPEDVVSRFCAWAAASRAAPAYRRSRRLRPSGGSYGAVTFWTRTMRPDRLSKSSMTVDSGV